MAHRSLMCLIGGPLVAGLVFGAAAVAASDPGQEAEDLSRLPGRVRRALFEAEQLRDAGELNQAAGVLEACLHEHPEEDHPLLRFHLANDLALAGRPEEALSHYLTATRQDSQYVGAWLNLGEVAYRLGRFSLAGEAFARAFDESAPESPELLYYAAVAFLAGDLPERSIPLLEELVSGRHGWPRLDWYRALLSAAGELDRETPGSGTVDEMLDFHAADPSAWHLAGQFAAASGDYRRAAVTLTVAGYLRPLTREQQVQLGSLYQAIGVPFQACNCLAQALADSASAAEYEQLVSACMAAHESERALRMLRRAIQRNPTARLWSLIGELRYAEEAYAESFEAFRQSAELDGRSGRPHLMMGYCTLALERPLEAARHLERAATFADQAEQARELLQRIAGPQHPE